MNRRINKLNLLIDADKYKVSKDDYIVITIDNTVSK